MTESQTTFAIGAAAAIGSMIGSAVARGVMGLFKMNATNTYLECAACGGKPEFLSNARAYVVLAATTHTRNHYECGRKGAK